VTRNPRTNPIKMRKDIKMIRDMLIFQKNNCRVTISVFWITITKARIIKIKMMIVFGFMKTPFLLIFSHF